MSAPAPDLFSDLARAGARVRTNGDLLRVSQPPGGLAPELVEALKARKAKLLPMLRACEALCRESGGDVLALAAQIEDAYRRLRAELKLAPQRRFACEVLSDESDPILAAVCVRGAGCAVLRMPQAKYDAGRLLEIVHRMGDGE